MTPPDAEDVLHFWFTELVPAQWWRVDPALDETIRARYGALHTRAAAVECWAWRATPRGRLAEVIVLDQLSRNLFRGTAQAFACDPLALGLTQEAVAQGADQALEPPLRAFLYMPYMHSESRAIHALAEPLFDVPGLENNLRAERQHRAIIERFGRYPHRNRALGRESTAQEVAFLQQPGSSF